MIPKMMGISARFPSLDGNRCTIPFTEWEQFKLLEKVNDSRQLTGIDNQFPSVTGIKRLFHSPDPWEQGHDSRPLTGIDNQFPSVTGIKRLFHTPDQWEQGHDSRPLTGIND